MGAFGLKVIPKEQTTERFYIDFHLIGALYYYKLSYLPHFFFYQFKVIKQEKRKQENANKLQQN